MVEIGDFWRAPPTAAKIDESSRFSPSTCITASMFTIGFFIARRRLKPTRSHHQFETGCLTITLGGHYHGFKTRPFSWGWGRASSSRANYGIAEEKKIYCMQSGSSANLAEHEDIKDAH